MKNVAIWSLVKTQFESHKAPLRFCLRVTFAGLLAFGLAQLGNFPLRGLWAVLTAVIVTQVSVGGSILAISEYVVGTLAGAIYASALALLLPHTTTLALAGVITLSIAPLALAAGINPMFRVAPFTAVIVLFISTEFAQSPIDSAIYRVMEVLIGGVSCIVVSLVVLPEKAHGRGLKAAAGVLERLAKVLPQLLEGFSRDLGPGGAVRLQDGLGDAITQFQSIVTETKRERLTYLHPAPDLASLGRLLLRLRHDFVIIGRAAIAPLPEPFVKRLNPPLTRLGESTSDYLHGCAMALVARQEPPALQPVEAAIAEYEAQFAVLRQEGLTRTLPGPETERVFALGFALEQLHQNLLDLQRRVEEYAGAPSASKPKT
jgi:uncharacterized membrane protein YccC